MVHNSNIFKIPDDIIIASSDYFTYSFAISYTFPTDVSYLNTAV